MNYDLIHNPRCPYGDNMPWREYYWEYAREVPEYEEDYWGSITDPDGIVRHRTTQQERKLALQDCADIRKYLSTLPKKGVSVLDVGCGPGALLSALPVTWDKHGVDVSSTALKEARRYATVHRGELPDIQFDNSIFDVVIMNHVIEHLRDPMLYLRTCHDLLQPSGLFLVATPDFDSGCARRFGLRYRLLHDKGHISLFTAHSFPRALQDIGFTVQEILYPYFETRWFTQESLNRLFDVSEVSPAFYGNFMLAVCTKGA